MFVPALVLLALILTNDLHQLAFFFPGGLAVGEDDYTRGPVYYAAAAWMAFLELASLTMLLAKSRVPGTRKVLWPPFAVFGCMLAYSALYNLHLPLLFAYMGDMTLCFCILTVLLWESCIQCGLIRTNTHYEGLFRASTVAMQIADSGGVRYASETARPVPPELMRRAAEGPVELDGNTLLRSAPIGGGRVYWQADVTAVNRLLGELRDIRAQLSENHELLAAEAALKEQRARVDERNRLYDRIARDTEPQLRALDAILGGFAPDDPGAGEKLARMCVLCAYVKRRTNLVLLAENTAGVQAGELGYCLRESAEYLRLWGAACSVECRLDGILPAASAELIYDAFEAAAEAAMPSLTALLANLGRDGGGVRLRLALENAAAAPAPGWDGGRLAAAGAALTAEPSEESLYLSLWIPEGGEAP
jgi:hypothetical protein